MENQQEISLGDYVVHKLLPINGGLQMSVLDISEDKAKVGFIDNEGRHKEEWFALEQLRLVNKPDGNFEE
jgi:hypothetical protein